MSMPWSGSKVPGNPDFARVQQQLRVQLQAHLAETRDPRALGLDAAWDYYPCYGQRRNQNWKVDPKR